jgi:hypothetical protein
MRIEDRNELIELVAKLSRKKHELTEMIGEVEGGKFDINKISEYETALVEIEDLITFVNIVIQKNIPLKGER